jgi:hypothetical protein
MCDTMPYDEFDCLCGATTCRHKVGGNDWQRPELQKRYAGYFSPHVQRRIDAQRAERRAFERAMRNTKTGAHAKPVAATLYK